VAHLAPDVPDWEKIRLVVFDVDGTLYDQRGLRLRMLREMLAAAVRDRDIRFIRILSAYRRIREELGDARHSDFEKVLTARTATEVGCSEEQVHATAAEWLERRPLPYLARYRYPGLPELFRALHLQGKKIGVFSDYPARAKIAALGLNADFIVCATDADVGVLKPHSKGLQILMERANVPASGTLMIGDRPERDGLAAQGAQVAALIRTSKSIPGWQTFARYDGPYFAKLGAA
jgi:HAD superfamily hydrolase (TIGR01549 family)